MVVVDVQMSDGMVVALVLVGLVRMIVRVDSTGIGLDLVEHWSIVEEIVVVVLVETSR